MNVTLLVVAAFLAIILLWKVRIVPKKCGEDFFSRSSSKGMQGFLALVILFHHISLMTRWTIFDDGSLVVFENLGTLCVGFFFFCSGYGLLHSLHTKENYLKGFLRKRVLSVLVPFFICNYTYILVTLLMGVRYNTMQLIKAFFGVQLLNQHLWFAVEIMILYVAFYLLFRFIKNEKISIVAMAGVILVIMVYGLYCGYDTSRWSQCRWFAGEWWYNTTLLFLVGMLVANTRSHLKAFVEKWYFLLLGCMIALFALFFKFTCYMLTNKGYWTEALGFTSYLDKIETLAVQVPMVIFFVLSLVLIMKRVRFSNPLLKFMGKISLESILMNNVFIFVFLNVPLHFGTGEFIVLEVVCTTVAAALLCKLKNVVLERK